MPLLLGGGGSPSGIAPLLLSEVLSLKVPFWNNLSPDG